MHPFLVEGEHVRDFRPLIRRRFGRRALWITSWGLVIGALAAGCGSSSSASVSSVKQGVPFEVTLNHGATVVLQTKVPVRAEEVIALDHNRSQLCRDEHGKRRFSRTTPTVQGDQERPDSANQPSTNHGEDPVGRPRALDSIGRECRHARPQSAPPAIPGCGRSHNAHAITWLTGARRTAPVAASSLARAEVRSLPLARHADQPSSSRLESTGCIERPELRLEVHVEPLHVLSLLRQRDRRGDKAPSDAALLHLRINGHAQQERMTTPVGGDVQNNRGRGSMHDRRVLCNQTGRSSPAPRPGNHILGSIHTICVPRESVHATGF
jgi:hypothetical protein